MPDLGTARIKIKVVSEGLSEFNNFVKGFRLIASEVSKATKNLNIFNAAQRALVRQTSQSLKNIKGMIAALKQQVTATNAATAANKKAAASQVIMAQKVKAVSATIIPYATAVKAVSAQVLDSFAGVKKLAAGFSKGATAINGFGQSLRQASFVMRDAGRQLLTLGIAMVAAFAPLAIIGSQFEQAVANVVAVSADLSATVGTSSTAIEDITQRFIELGETTVFTATQVAEAAKNLALAGFNATQISEALPSVLRLATTGSLELAQAAEIAATTLKAFGLEARNLDRVVDVLAQTATNSNTTIESLSSALSQASAISATLGQSIEQVVAGLGLLGNAGVSGSRAGTGLSQVFLDLADDVEKVDGVLKRFGSSFDRVNPEVNSLLDIIKEFERVNISTAATFEIFEKRAARAFLAIKNQGSDALEALIDLNKAASGVARTVEAIKLDTLIGDLTLLRSVVDSVFITLFEEVREPLRNLVQNLIKIVGQIKAFIKANKELIAPFVKVGLAISAVLVTVGSFLSVLGSATAIVAAPLVALGAFLTIIVGLGEALIPVVLTLAALAIPIAGIGAFIAQVAVPAFFALKDNVVGLGKVLSAFNNNVIQPFIKGFKEAFNAGFISRIIPAYNRLRNAVGKLFGQFESALGRLRGGDFEDFGDFIAKVLVVAIEEFINFLTFAVNTIRLLDWNGLAIAINVVTIVISDFSTAVKTAGSIVSAHGSLIRGFIAGIAGTILPRFLKDINGHNSTPTEDSLENVANRSAEAAEKLDKVLTQSAKNLVGFRKELAEIEKASELFKNLTTLKPVQIKELIDLDISSDDVNKFLDKIKSEIDQLKAAGDPELAGRIEQLEEIQDRVLEGAKKVFETIENSVKQGTDATIKQLETVEKSIEAHEIELAILQEKRAESNLITDEEIKLAETLENEIQLRDILRRIDKGRLDDINKNLTAEGITADVLNELLVIQTKRFQIQSEGVKAAEAEKEIMEEIAGIQKSLEEAQLNALERRIAAAKELEASQNAAIATQKKNIEQQAAFLKQQLDDANKGGTATKVVDPSTGETVGDQFRKQISDLNARLKEANNLEIKSKKQLNDSLTEIQEEDEAKRNEKLIQSRLELAKKLGDLESEANETRALRNIEIEREIKDTFLLTGDAVRDAQVQKEIDAFRKVEQASLDAELTKLTAKEKTNKAAKKSEGIEKKVVDNLAGQVESVKQLIQLLGILDRVETIREKRAIRSAERAVDNEFAQKRLQKEIVDKGAAGEDTRTLERRLAKLRAIGGLLQSKVDKDAESAGLSSVDIQAAIVASKVALDTAKQAVKDQTKGLTENVNDALGSLALAFSAAPQEWVEAFLKNWTSSSDKMVQAVADIMSKIKKLFDPTVRNSPSIVDLWRSQVDTVKSGIKQMNAEINGNLPNLSRLNLGAAVTAPMPQAIPMSSTTNRNSSLTDNRQVNMNINNAADSAALARKLARELKRGGF